MYIYLAYNDSQKHPAVYLVVTYNSCLQKDIKKDSLDSLITQILSGKLKILINVFDSISPDSPARGFKIITMSLHKCLYIERALYPY